MRVLGIETSGLVGSVALCEWEGASAFAPLGASADKSAPDPGGRGQPASAKATAGPPKRLGSEGGKPAPTLHILWERAFTQGLIHGRELAPAVQAALAETGTAFGGLGLIAVSQGPGSYTGLRVGIAFAKTLAWSVGRPLVGVVSLAAMAENVAGAAIAAPVIDARWGQVYGAVYRREQDTGRGDAAREFTPSGAKGPYGWKEIVAPQAAAPESFAAQIPAGAAVFGDGLKRYRSVLLRPGLTEGDPAWAVPRAAVVARLGAEAFRASGGRDETMTLVPLYLRPTEAEVNAGLALKLPHFVQHESEPPRRQGIEENAKNGY